ncbi:MAG: molybdate ABC transporter substrate-binding protein [Endomicrobiia bacterium]
MKKILFLIIIFLSLNLYSKTLNKELYFFCGAAVKVPMEEIIKNYQQKTGIKINVIYGGSGTLLSQMELSKKGDVYLAGSPDYIIIGEQKNLLQKNSDKLVTYLVPAIIVPKNNPKKIYTLDDLTKKGVRIGIGNPETVCLGLYGIELLEHNNLLEKVFPNIVTFAKSCEDTAMLTVLNKVDAIIGWDVFESWNSDKVEWIKIDKNKISRISYIPIAIPVFVKDKNLAENFINYVLSKEGQDVFKKWGYIIDKSEALKFAPKAKIGGEYKLSQKFYDLLKSK